MTDNAGVVIPSVFRDGAFGDRYLGVTPIARGIDVGNALVVLVAVERFADRSMLTVRVMLQEESTELESGALAWPSLQLRATDDVGTSYQIGGSGGNGTTADYEISFGITPAIPSSATRLDVVLENIAWRNLDGGATGSQTSGPWRIAIDLSNELPASMG